MSPLPTRIYAGVTVPDTPLITAALAYARAHLREPFYNHVLRSWLFGFIIASKIPALQTRDQEIHSIAAILHDLGWDHTNTLTTTTNRFEVDGANSARDFLARETKWDQRRIQLVWDAIALHTTTSIAQHKEPEVAATNYGIAADFTGPWAPAGSPMALMTQAEYDAVIAELPRGGMKEELREMMCGLCRSKPETTYDNFVGGWGERYVEGYSLDGKRAIDFVEAGLERLG